MYKHVARNFKRKTILRLNPNQIIDSLGLQQQQQQQQQIFHYTLHNLNLPSPVKHTTLLSYSNFNIKIIENPVNIRNVLSF